MTHTELLVLGLAVIVIACYTGIVTKTVEIVECRSLAYPDKRKYVRTTVRVLFLTIFVAHRPY